MRGLETPLVVTDQAVYVRMPGSLGGNYEQAGLADWAQRIRDCCAAGHAVYMYFNHDIAACARYATPGAKGAAG
jgi:uncharacterized protein YecE (DUF72 family)